MEKRVIKMDSRGHRGDIGGWEKGKTMTAPDDLSFALAEELVSCGLAHYMRAAPAVPAATKKRKEVKANGPE